MAPAQLDVRAALCPICQLCAQDSDTFVWRNDKLRVIRADEAGFPAFTALCGTPTWRNFQT